MPDRYWLRNFRYLRSKGVRYFSINHRFNRCGDSAREFELTLLKLELLEDSTADWGGFTNRMIKQPWALEDKGLKYFWKLAKDACDTRTINEYMDINK